MRQKRSITLVMLLLFRLECLSVEIYPFRFWIRYVLIGFLLLRLHTVSKSKETYSLSKTFNIHAIKMNYNVCFCIRSVFTGASMNYIVGLYRHVRNTFITQITYIKPWAHPLGFSKRNLLSCRGSLIINYMWKTIQLWNLPSRS